VLHDGRRNGNVKQEEHTFLHGDVETIQFLMDGHGLWLEVGALHIRELVSSFSKSTDCNSLVI